ncbi:MAG: DNA polymerase Y family protein, partial [Planctomycetota bacterium]
MVIARCHRAAEMGVQIQMVVAQAKEMVRSANGRVEEHQPLADLEALKQLANQVSRQISPMMGLETLDRHRWTGQVIHQPDGLWVDVAGASHLFGDETGMMLTTHRLLRQNGYAAKMAIADTLGAAWAVTHQPDASPLRTSPAIPVPLPGNHLPDGWIVPRGETETILRPLNVQGLRISNDTAGTLARLGVQTIEQLMQLPRGGLATRLGNSLVQRLDQALGQRDETFQVHSLPAEDHVQLEMEYPTDDRLILCDRMKKLADQIRAGLA